MFICRQKINFILHVFLEILQKYCKLVILGTLGMPDSAHPKWYYQLVEKFCVHPQAKNQLHSPCFFEDAAKIGKLLIWVLWACLAMHTQNGTIKLSKTSMFICTPKIHFIIHFLLEILDFKEPSNLIGWQYFGPLAREPEYCQIWDWWWIINSNVSFQF